MLKTRHFLLARVRFSKRVGIVYLGFLVVLGFLVILVALVVLAKLDMLCIILFRFANKVDTNDNKA